MSTNGYEFLEINIIGHIATITMCRSDKLNALNHQMIAELHRALDELSDNIQVRAVILTGTGRGFSSGADVTEMLDFQERSADNSAQMPKPGITDLGLHIRKMKQPIIAAINGIAAGAGLAIALACDIRLASEDARFTCAFVKRSFVPDSGTSYMLPSLVGIGTAMEMALTGNIYDSKWALQKGLVNSVVSSNRLLECANDLASNIADNPPICVSLIKPLMYLQQAHFCEVLDNEREANYIASSTQDSKEAILSFLEKRTPHYRGE